MGASVFLNQRDVRSILSLYHMNDLEDFGEVALGAKSTSYWVRVRGLKYLLRIAERRRVRDMVFEKELLEHLRSYGLPVPELLRNVAHGSFVPWATRGRFVSLFRYVPGRRIGRFELSTNIVMQIGRFLAEFHRLARRYRRATDEPLPKEIERDVLRIERRIKKGLFPKEMIEDFKFLEHELQSSWLWQSQTLQSAMSESSMSEVAEGIIHGALSLERVRFHQGRLVGVIGFENACTGRLCTDVAVALNEFCWRPQISLDGPKGEYDSALCAALFAGYQEVRPLSVDERKWVMRDLQWANVVRGLSAMSFEAAFPEAPQIYDYRHSVARLRCLRELVGLESRGEQPLLTRTF